MSCIGVKYYYYFTHVYERVELVNNTILNYTMVHLNADMSNPFEIVVGTYEQYLLGYKVENIVNEYKLEKSFATHSHLASVRSVASSKHYLASAGADDSVYLYDMKYRIESGRLMHHNDTINHISFTPDGSHLFTCSNDGTIAAIRCGNWQIEKHWQKPHKGLAVNTLAIHPTGKIALSMGADGILRTWNLIKGRQAYATNLLPRLKLDAKNVTVLKWSPNGEKYLLAVNQRVDVYLIELAGVNDEIKFDAKIVCVEFLKDDLIAVGLENGQIKFYDLENSVETVGTIAHDIRVKCMAHHKDLLVTASSLGEIKLWRFSRQKLDMLQSINCGARITCLTLGMPCKRLIPKEEVKLEEEIDSKKKKSKFRLRQEVIVEHEDAWEVTDTNISELKLTKSKSKKKRDIQVTEEGNDLYSVKKNKPVNKKKKKRDKSTVQNEVDNRSKKKKLLMTDTTDDNLSPKKRKEQVILQQEETYTPIKKIKKDSEKTIEKSIRKLKATASTTDEDTPPKKKKKKTETRETTTLIKKKRKQ